MDIEEERPTDGPDCGAPNGTQAPCAPGKGFYIKKKIKNWKFSKSQILNFRRSLIPNGTKISFLLDCMAIKPYSRSLALNSILKGHFRRKNYPIIDQNSKNYHRREWLDFNYEFPQISIKNLANWA